MKHADQWALFSPGGRLLASAPTNVDLVGIDVGPVELVHIAQGLGRISAETAAGLFEALELRVFVHRGFTLCRGAFVPAVAPVSMDWLHVATPLNNLQLDAECLAVVQHEARING